MSNDTTIAQHHLPSLTAGLYEVDIKQNVSHQKKGRLQEVQSKSKFAVDAARFTLEADTIYSCYPPASTIGNYDAHLPHIVLNRRTLPWERTIDGLPHPASSDGDANAIPWMCLLLLDQDEMLRVTTKQLSLDDVIYTTDKSDGIARPMIYPKSSTKIPKLMTWESSKEMCNTIDLPHDIYESHIPSLSDLPLMAHSKDVHISHKDQEGIGDIRVENDGQDEAVFSVLVGNRIIEKNKVYTAFLVSLEGHKDYINDHGLIQQNSVRLVVLSSWSFTSGGEANFEYLVDTLEIRPMSIDHFLSPDSKLRRYTKYGHYPMKHAMRDGTKNVSWYRGPLASADHKFDVEKVSYTCSDAALRYDGDTGLLDVSIAAAWELGKVLALQSQEFMKAIVAWHAHPIIDTEQVVEKTITKRMVINWLENIDDDQVSPASVSYRPFPAEIKTFLSRLAKLEGVPLPYIVPDQKYIIAQDGSYNDIITFSIDPLWIFALLDGAVSITRKTHTDTTTQVNHIIHDLYGEGIVSGFLIHSALISGWRGIEVKGYNTSLANIDEAISKKPVDTIRLNRITPSLMLCIFKGKCESLTIKQPYEGLSFGFVTSSNEAKEIYSIPLKDSNGRISESQKVVLNPSNQSQSLMSDSKNIIDILKLSAALQAKTKDKKFTSAEFAYQLIHSPIEGIINLNYSK